MKRYLAFQCLRDNLQYLGGGEMKGATMLAVVYGYSQPVLQFADSHETAK